MFITSCDRDYYICDVDYADGGNANDDDDDDEGMCSL